MTTDPYNHHIWVQQFMYTLMQMEIFYPKNIITNDWYLLFCIVKEMLWRNLYLESLSQLLLSCAYQQQNKSIKNYSEGKVDKKGKGTSKHDWQSYWLSLNHS